MNKCMWALPTKNYSGVTHPPSPSFLLLSISAQKDFTSWPQGREVGLHGEPLSPTDPASPLLLEALPEGLRGAEQLSAHSQGREETAQLGLVRYPVRNVHIRVFPPTGPRTAQERP